MASHVAVAAETRMDLSFDPAAPEASAAAIVRAMVPSFAALAELRVSRVLGGATNVLYRVERAAPRADAAAPDPVLLRCFGAEGLIDRDAETAAFAALAADGIAPPYHGRFANGRLEGWLVGFEPLAPAEFADAAVSRACAAALARLHAFEPPPAALPGGGSRDSNLWPQLRSWLDGARGARAPIAARDGAAPRLALYDALARRWAALSIDALEARVAARAPPPAVVFAHNDALAGNILVQRAAAPAEGGAPGGTTPGGAVERCALVDFEYGGMNYLGFDLANHLCEWIGGTERADMDPSLERFPDAAQRRAFVAAYLEAAARARARGASAAAAAPPAEAEIDALLGEVDEFVVVDHLFWGLWAVNQEASEGCAEHDYLHYATVRLGEFWRLEDARAAPTSGT